jgi:hypothetical protein
MNAESEALCTVPIAFARRHAADEVNSLVIGMLPMPRAATLNLWSFNGVIDSRNWTSVPRDSPETTYREDTCPGDFDLLAFPKTREVCRAWTP